MPKNGVAVALPPVTVPVSPLLDPQPADIVVRLAEAAAAAAVAAGCGLADYEADGRLSDATRAAVGSHFTKISMLRLEHFGEIDLASVRAASKRILWEKHGDILRSHLDATTIERGFNELIDLVLDITARAVAAERAFLAQH
jgi:hypothetical protein